MEIKIATWILVTILSSCLYRLGGASKEGNWYDFLCNTKVRDFGVPLCGILLMVLLYHNYGWKILLSYFLTFGLYFGSLTTYWKKKGTEATWKNWLMTGFGYSVAFLPFAFVSGLWLGFALRCVICSIATMIWSQKTGNVVWEECGRGVIANGTLLLLLI